MVSRLLHCLPGLSAAGSLPALAARAAGLYRLFIVLLVLALPQAGNTSSLLIWPIHPVLESGQIATALWIENRGKSTSYLQLRVFDWEQRDGENQYFPQDSIIGSPPLMEIAAGERQLVRLILQKPIPAETEKAWRLILDEIPIINRSGSTHDQYAGALHFQMRYSLPLFSYGEGLVPPANYPKPAAMISWREVLLNGQRFLEIQNHGRTHVRLSQLVFKNGDKTKEFNQGLLGYILPHSQMRWPLPYPIGGWALYASINGKTCLRIPDTPPKSAPPPSADPPPSSKPVEAG